MTKTIDIAGCQLGGDNPTYFIADIAANHDGDLDRAKALIALAKEAGADAAKFQHFKARKIVSDYGFRRIPQSGMSHQGDWKKSVVEVYEGASVPVAWTAQLKAECDRVGITFLTSPYDFESIDEVAPYVAAMKAGSGLVSWPAALEKMARLPVPMILATGASDISDVVRAVRVINAVNSDLVLMQCNTNYTAQEGNYDHINLRVLHTYRAMFPNAVLGLSDHMHSLAPVLGAVALGARVIERHFTDDNDREGPDHKFAMNPQSWSQMVRETRILERSLGCGDKEVAANEVDTYVIQRCCLRAAREIEEGEVIDASMVEVLRPATPGALMPWQLAECVGRRACRRLEFGQELTARDIE